MLDNKVEIKNKVEGPILVRSLEMSIAEWSNRLDPRKTDDRNIPYDINDGKINPFRQSIIDQLSEQLGESAKIDPLYNALTHPNDRKYIYRCFGVKTADKDPMDAVNYNGYERIVKEDDQVFYSHDHAWFLKLFPCDFEMPTSYMLIYNNDPNVFPPEKTWLWTKSFESSIPTLRDLLIGVIKINWK